ncbi:MAG: hypothetical protein ACK4V6_01670 [Microthrixaceae bacterium]
MSQVRRRATAVAAVLLLLALTASACANGGDPSSSPGSEAAPVAGSSSKGTDATGAGGAEADGLPVDPTVESLLDETGSVTPAQALAAFAAVVGPVPGAEDPPELQVSEDPHRAGLVIDLVEHHWDSYDEAQQRAIAELLLGSTPLAVAETTVTGPVSAAELDDLGAPVAAAAPARRGRSATVVASPEQDAVAYLDTVGHFVGAYQRLMGVQFTQHLRVRVVDAPFALGAAYAISDPFRVELETSVGPVIDGVAESDRTRTDCLVQVGQELGRRGGMVLRAALAHEAFHCVQYALVPEGVELSPWMHEGTAAWAGEVMANSQGGTASSVGWWNEYLRGRGGNWSLFGAAYSAIGFFSHLAVESRVNLWPSLSTALQSGRNDDDHLAEVTRGAPADWAATFATAPAQRGDWGSAWTTATPGVTTSARRVGEFVQSGRGRRTLAAPIGNAVWRADPGDAVIIRIGARGHGSYRFGDAGGEQSFDGDSANGAWCAMDPCLCPDGRPPSGGPYASLPRSLQGQPMVIGAASPSRTETTSVTLEFRGLDDECEEPTTTTATPAGRFQVSGTAATTMNGGPPCAVVDRMIVFFAGDASRVSDPAVPTASVTVTATAGSHRNASVVWNLNADVGGVVDARTSTVTVNDDLRSGTFSGEAVITRRDDFVKEQVTGTWHC